METEMTVVETKAEAIAVPLAPGKFSVIDIELYHYLCIIKNQATSSLFLQENR
jgi:hypothetical protein